MPMSSHLHYSTTILTPKKYSEIKQCNVQTPLFHKITTAVSHKENEICHTFHTYRIALFFLQHCPIKMHKYHKSEQYLVQNQYTFLYPKYTGWRAIH